MKDKRRKIVLEDGQVYTGISFGSGRTGIFEIVFNTSMAGYQEIISDPSYTDQAVVMTYPLIGNYGMNDDDYETDVPSAGALIVRDINDLPSNFRSRESLGHVMERFGIPGVSGTDTRKLTRSIRDKGSRKAAVAYYDEDTEEVLERIKKYAMPRDQVMRVSTDKQMLYPGNPGGRHIVLIDCGAKKNIIRSLRKRGCTVTCVPWNTSARDIEALGPDGIMISNGPGDPEDVPETVETVRNLRGKYPMCGICLGHQITALAYGASTYKLKFGHRGGNHPVRNLAAGTIEITSQNHSYAVDAESLEGTGLMTTHRNLLDGTVEGCACEADRVITVQYHPESAPGPEDSGYIFDAFLAYIH